MKTEWVEHDKYNRNFMMQFLGARWKMSDVDGQWVDETHLNYMTVVLEALRPYISARTIL